jgi:hypothetical protein
MHRLHRRDQVHDLDHHLDVAVHLLLVHQLMDHLNDTD